MALGDPAAAADGSAGAADLLHGHGASVGRGVVGNGAIPVDAKSVRLSLDVDIGSEEQKLPPALPGGANHGLHLVVCVAAA